MKKICYSVITVVLLCAASLIAFAEPAENTGVTIGRIEAIDYILLVGLGIFLLGMLFVLLSMFVGKRKKPVDTELEDYDEYEDYPEEVEASEVQEVIEQTEQEAPAVEEFESDETADEPAEETEESAQEEEAELEETEVEEEPVTDAYQDSEQDEAEEVESEPEPEPEKAKVRITLSGLNNSDVKVMDFTDKITVGRRSGNDIMISDSAVSGKHCELSFEDGALYITDLESTNGTYINDEPVVRAEIKSGDTLILGKNKYRINISI